MPFHQLWDVPSAAFNRNMNHAAHTPSHDSGAIEAFCFILITMPLLILPCLPKSRAKMQTPGLVVTILFQLPVSDEHGLAQDAKKVSFHRTTIPSVHLRNPKFLCKSS
jgi:hypothetical protein